MKSLAGDPQIWKALYYDRFVRPRASRIPGVRALETSVQNLLYSSKMSKWLDDDHLVRGGSATNWKRQYKLRHNWCRGSARISETRVSDRPSTPPLLLRLHDDIVVMVDATAGLKAWSLGGNDRILASTELCGTGPTSLALDDDEVSKDQVHISVGFEDGSFAIYRLARSKRLFKLQYHHPPSRNGTIQAIAYAGPYLLTMAGTSLLSLYRLADDRGTQSDNDYTPPTLLSSLRSQTAHTPIQLAIRTSSGGIVASIAYAIPTFTLGWSVGLQELRLTANSAILDSRIASASSSKSFAPPMFHSHLHINGPWIPAITKPTSLSYNHPYLLSAHSDNTLTLYMVTSNADELSIGAAERLWGHTTSVSGAHVGDRGKAVSVGRIGDELRVWELEGGLSSSSSRKRAAAGEASVQVRTEKRRNSWHNARRQTSLQAQKVLKTDFDEAFNETNVTKGWVAFDEEKVVLLREKLQGAQALVVYDFS